MDYLPNPDGKLTAYFCVREFANSLGTCTRTIHRLLLKGELGYIRIGRNIRIPKTEIERWLAHHIVEANKKVAAVNSLLTHD